MYSVNAYERCCEDGMVYYDVFIAETFEEADDIVHNCIYELAVEMDGYTWVERIHNDAPRYPLDNDVDNDIWKVTVTCGDNVWKRVIVAQMRGNHSEVALEGDAYDDLD